MKRRQRSLGRNQRGFVMIALVVFGLVALSQLDTDEFPEVEPPVVVASLIYPGASPGTVERELLEPLEE